MLNLTKNGVDPIDILSSAMKSKGWKVGGWKTTDRFEAFFYPGSSRASFILI